MDEDMLVMLLSTVKDLKAFLRRNAKAFDWSRLQPIQKLELLKEDKAFYSKYITDVTKGAGASSKALILAMDEYEEYHHLFKLTKNEVSLIPHNLVIRLYNSKYGDEYYDGKVFDKMPMSDRISYFLKFPEKCHKKMQPHIDSRFVYNLCCGKQADFILKYCKTAAAKTLLEPVYYSSLLKVSYIWTYLLTENLDESVPLFFKNIDIMKSMSAFREVITSHPILLTHINLNLMERANLTPKQWLLLLAKVIKNDRSHQNVLKDWDLDKDIKKWLKEEVFLDVLKGKDKASDPLTRASKIVLG